jgi:hypothetical protein
VQSCYRPAAAFDAAPSSQLAPLLATPAKPGGAPRRAARTTATPFGRLPLRGGAVVGVDAPGRMAFLLVP